MNVSKQTMIEVTNQLKKVTQERNQLYAALTKMLRVHDQYVKPSDKAIAYSRKIINKIKKGN